jgi:hypothetical protein
MNLFEKSAAMKAAEMAFAENSGRKQAPLQILVIGNLEAASLIRQQFPEAQITVVLVPTEELIPELPSVRILRIDFTHERLPFEEESFDYIIADRCLEKMNNKQDFAFAMFFWLKQTGCLVTSFFDGNGKMDRYGEAGCEADILSVRQLLAISFYKEIEIIDIDECSFLVPAVFKAVGNERVWLVRAYRSTHKAAVLKQYFVPEIRRQLAIFLRRVAHDVDRNQSCQNVWLICDQYKISLLYIVAFIQNTMLQPLLVLTFLGDWAMDNGRCSEGINLMNIAAGRNMENFSQKM